MAYGEDDYARKVYSANQSGRVNTADYVQVTNHVGGNGCPTCAPKHGHCPNCGAHLPAYPYTPNYPHWQFPTYPWWNQVTYQSDTATANQTALIITLN